MTKMNTIASTVLVRIVILVLLVLRGLLRPYLFRQILDVSALPSILMLSPRSFACASNYTSKCHSRCCGSSD